MSLQPFTLVTGKAAPMLAANIDTDVIMPKQFLKGIDRSGLEARSCECYGVVRLAYDRLSCAHGAPRRTPGMGNLGLAAPVVHRQPMQTA